MIEVLAAAGLALALAVPVAGPPADRGGASETMRVGRVDLARCPVLPGAWCGHIVRAWDPAGAIPGSVTVGFAFVPASSGRSIGTLVPHEGGPGYSTTGSGVWFAPMYGDLMVDRDLLLVDQRGTGRTSAIACPDLDAGTLPYIRAVGRCARSLGELSGLYGTAYSADDLAAVLDALAIDRIDMYGDSYGTFFGQVFAARHPDRLRTLILDASYPTYGESAWYPTQAAALRRSLREVCARSDMCAAGSGRPDELLRRLLQRLREAPVDVRAPGGDGRLHRVRLDPAAVAAVAYNATYLPPTYREFTGAVRAALAGDHLPLGRLYAEYFFVGNYASNPREYSAGAEAAVSCHDYPQLFSLKASRQERQRQYRDAFARKERSRPDLYGPFTIEEYRRSGWTSFGMCLRWPAPLPGQDFGPPRPTRNGYPDVPTLVMSGELDTITTVAEGEMVAARFPGATHVVLANGLHVAGGTGPLGCGDRLVRHVVRTGSVRLPPSLIECAAEQPPIRAVGDYPSTWQRTALPPGAQEDDVTRRVVTAANTAADVLDRWWQCSCDRGRGLRGGRWSYAGNRTVRFEFDDVRLVSDLPVSGAMRWNRDTGLVHIDLRVPGIASITGRWNAVMAGAEAQLVADGRRLVFLAP